MLLPPKCLTWPRGLIDVLAGRAVAQRLVRMYLIVVGQLGGELLDDGSCIGRWVHTDVVAFEGAHEGLCHHGGRRAADLCGARDGVDVAREALGVAGDIRATVVGQPLRTGQLTQAVDSLRIKRSACNARYSDAGTTSSPTPAVVNAPCASTAAM